MRVVFLCSLFVAACSTSPAARSPLRESLAAAGTSDVEQAVTQCLTDAGWKVDPFPGTMADAEVMTGVKNGARTEVYVHDTHMTPRITGGPDDGDSFWSCLPRELSHPAPAASTSASAAPSASAAQ